MALIASEMSSDPPDPPSPDPHKSFLLSLPPEIHLLIISELSPLAILGLGATNRAFLSLCRSEDVWRKVVDEIVKAWGREVRFGVTDPGDDGTTEGTLRGGISVQQGELGLGIKREETDSTHPSLLHRSQHVASR